VSQAPPEQTAKIFVSTGELSGEMHAAYVIGALQQLRAAQGLPPALVEGNGSQRMAAQGVRIVHDVARWSEIGIVLNLIRAPFFLRIMRETLRHILRSQPEMVILVDSRVLNLKLAKALREHGYSGQIVYYVSPVRWESLYNPAEHARSLRNPRFKQLKQYCDLAIPIYPVSLGVYDELQIPYIFPGHPLCEIARPRLSDREFTGLTGVGLSPRPLLIGALTGSRVGEVREIAPHVFAALRLIREALQGEAQVPPLQLVATVAHPALRRELLSAARHAGLDDLVLLDSDYTYDLMARANLMIVKSGTGLHECMLLGVPALMCYRVSAAVAWIARYIMRFKMPFYGFPNLLAGRAVVPELIQEDCRYTRIAEAAGELLFDEQQRAEMQAAFAELRARVCHRAPLHQIAQALQDRLAG
jgi:lipid-A-disaccharide synthase